MDEPIDLGVSDKTVLDAIALLHSNKKDVNLDINSQILEMFIILILVPPEPFKNAGVDCVSFAIDTLLTAPANEEQNDVKHGIACLLACQNHLIAVKIFETKKAQLDTLVN